ncbi:MAG TPA: alpha/beta fold hydrolase [Tepidisphaeraceae bacterium]|nr:alpha/beta fold hydrolase [Tepidisphaeraceae bacterium]
MSLRSRRYGAAVLGLTICLTCAARETIAADGAAKPVAGDGEPEASRPPLPPHADLSWYPAEGGARRPLRTVADWEARRRDVLTGMQAVTGEFPGNEKRVPLDVKVEAEAAVGDSVVRRTVTFATGPGRRVAAYLFLPARGGGVAKRPAVLCLHPTGALGKGIVAGMGDKPNRAYAIELARRGYVTLAPDYPTFGDYKCEFDPAEGWHSGTMRAVWDNVRAVDLLQGLPEVDGERLGAIGHSLGGHNAIFTAVFEPRIKAVVSSCGFTRFHRYYDGNLTGWTSPRYMPRIATAYGKDPDRMPFDFPELLAAIAPRAFLTVSPERDANFDVRGVRESVAEAAKIFELYGKRENLSVIYPDCAHDFPDDAREKAYAFVDRHLGRK